MTVVVQKWPGKASVQCFAQHVLSLVRTFLPGGWKCHWRNSKLHSSCIGSFTICLTCLWHGQMALWYFCCNRCEFPNETQGSFQWRGRSWVERGWAYFVEETAYKSYLSKLINEPQPVHHTGSSLGFVLTLPYRKVVVPAIVQWMQRTWREPPALLQQVLVLLNVPDMVSSTHVELGICRKAKSRLSRLYN